jgi:hypothetical protein
VVWVCVDEKKEECMVFCGCWRGIAIRLKGKEGRRVGREGG